MGLMGRTLDIYPLVIFYIAIENCQLVSSHLPSYKMVIFHSYVNVYQRVIMLTQRFSKSQINADGL